MASRQQVKVHINRAVRARAMEQKLDEIALAIGELPDTLKTSRRIARVGRHRMGARLRRCEHRAGGYSGHLRCSAVSTIRQSNELGVQTTFGDQRSVGRAPAIVIKLNAPGAAFSQSLKGADLDLAACIALEMQYRLQRRPSACRPLIASPEMLQRGGNLGYAVNANLIF
jgi:hypothetical protein